MLRKLVVFLLEKEFLLRILQVLAYFFCSFGDVAALRFFLRLKLVYVETDDCSLKNESLML